MMMMMMENDEWIYFSHPSRHTTSPPTSISTTTTTTTEEGKKEDKYRYFRSRHFRLSYLLCGNTETVVVAIMSQKMTNQRLKIVIDDVDIPIQNTQSSQSGKLHTTTAFIQLIDDTIRHRSLFQWHILQSPILWQPWYVLGLEWLDHRHCPSSLVSSLDRWCYRSHSY